MSIVEVSAKARRDGGTFYTALFTVLVRSNNLHTFMDAIGARALFLLKVETRHGSLAMSERTFAIITRAVAWWAYAYSVDREGDGSFDYLREMTRVLDCEQDADPAKEVKALLKIMRTWGLAARIVDADDVTSGRVIATPRALAIVVIPGKEPRFGWVDRNFVVLGGADEGLVDNVDAIRLAFDPSQVETVVREFIKISTKKVHESMRSTVEKLVHIRATADQTSKRLEEEEDALDAKTAVCKVVSEALGKATIDEAGLRTAVRVTEAACKKAAAALREKGKHLADVEKKLYVSEERRRDLEKKCSQAEERCEAAEAGRVAAEKGYIAAEEGRIAAGGRRQAAEEQRLDAEESADVAEETARAAERALAAINDRVASLRVCQRYRAAFARYLDTETTKLRGLVANGIARVKALERDVATAEVNERIASTRVADISRRIDEGNARIHTLAARAAVWMQSVVDSVKDAAERQSATLRAAHDA